MKNITVIGTGTMGNGIAHVFALSGFRVSLVGVSQELLDKALNTIAGNLDRQVKKEQISEADKNNALSNITTYTSVRDGVSGSDLVIEAVFEDEAVKKQIFEEADKYAPAHAVLASNTSSISITRLGAFTSRPEQVIGMHFMNPVPVMKLIEVIRGYSTSGETAKIVAEFSLKLGKTPVEVNDYSGFVANRILMPMLNEAIHALYEGVAGVKEIDAVMKLGMAHPMGPLQLADFIGLDICHNILLVMYNDFKNPKYAPCPLLVKMVEAGNLGVKTGKGFYKYTPGSKEIEVAERFK
jgi:3-hydroxybutyryl-CoA dehydrogenase